MTKLPDTVVEYSEYAAQEFLQTAVFIDDRIYERKDRSVGEPKTISVPKQRKKVTKSTGKTASEPVVSDDPAEPNEYPSHDIVMSFAKKQIICSPYQPQRGAKVSPTSDIFLLCRSADIVIVDWDMYGDRGERALELIDGLIQQAVNDVPEQLRLILVYTQEINLRYIADQLYEKVSASIREELNPLQEEGGLAFHTLNSRVVVLGKASRDRSHLSNEYENHVVEEKKLADEAVKQFAKLASGLLHAAVLLGLAGIKKNSRKILSKFNVTLDPAFLTHRAMCWPEEDASTHVIPLLVSEIESVLEDVLRNPLISAELIEDWCKNIWQPGNHLHTIFNDKKLDVRAIGSEICREGFTRAREKWA